MVFPVPKRMRFGQVLESQRSVLSPIASDDARIFRGALNRRAHEQVVLAFYAMDAEWGGGQKEMFQVGRSNEIRTHEEIDRQHLARRAAHVMNEFLAFRGNVAAEFSHDGEMRIFGGAEEEMLDGIWPWQQIVIMEEGVRRHVAEAGDETIEGTKIVAEHKVAVGHAQDILGERIFRLVCGIDHGH